VFSTHHAEGLAWNKKGFFSLLCSTLRYATLRYATLRYATLRYATLLYSTLCQAIWVNKSLSMLWAMCVDFFWGLVAMTYKNRSWPTTRRIIIPPNSIGCCPPYNPTAIAAATKLYPLATRNTTWDPKYTRTKLLKQKQHMLLSLMVDPSHLSQVIYLPICSQTSKRDTAATMDVKQCDCLKHYLCMATWSGQSWQLRLTVWTTWENCLKSAFLLSRTPRAAGQ
jgi:hypothetical protein